VEARFSIRPVGRVVSPRVYDCDRRQMPRQVVVQGIAIPSWMVAMHRRHLVERRRDLRVVQAILRTFRDVEGNLPDGPWVKELVAEANKISCDETALSRWLIRVGRDPQTRGEARRRQHDANRFMAGLVFYEIRDQRMARRQKPLRANVPLAAVRRICLRVRRARRGHRRSSGSTGPRQADPDPEHLARHASRAVLA
jgi:hypothetical protein